MPSKPDSSRWSGMKLGGSLLTARAMAGMKACVSPAQALVWNVGTSRLDAKVCASRVVDGGARRLIDGHQAGVRVCRGVMAISLASAGRQGWMAMSDPYRWASPRRGERVGDAHREQPGAASGVMSVEAS